jgi:hypothetical protein
MRPPRRHGDNIFLNGRINTIPRPNGVTTQSFPQKDFAVRSMYDNRTNMTKDTGINKREMFEKKFGVLTVYTREHFRPGTIINANHFEEAWNHNPSTSYAKTLVVGNAGEKICTKRRYMILVAQNDSCYTTVPIFTFQGQGISQKSAKHEYVSITDHKIRAKDFVPLSEHAPLVRKHLKDPVWIREESTAWVAYLVSRQCFLPVTLTGRLGEVSTQGLIKLYQRFMRVKGNSSSVPSRTASAGERGFEGAETGDIKSAKFGGTITTLSAIEQPSALETLSLTDADSWTVVGGSRSASKSKNCR